MGRIGGTGGINLSAGEKCSISNYGIRVSQAAREASCKG